MSNQKAKNIYSPFSKKIAPRLLQDHSKITLFGMLPDFQEIAELHSSLHHSLNTLQSTMQQFIAPASQIIVIPPPPQILLVDSSFSRHPPLAPIPVLQPPVLSPFSVQPPIPLSLPSVPTGDSSQKASFSDFLLKGLRTNLFSQTA
jgi:hypothetical protein